MALINSKDVRFMMTIFISLLWPCRGIGAAQDHAKDEVCNYKK